MGNSFDNKRPRRSKEIRLIYRRDCSSKAVTQSIDEAGDGSEIFVVFVVFAPVTLVAVLPVYSYENSYEPFERYRVVRSKSYQKCFARRYVISFVQVAAEPTEGWIRGIQTREYLYEIVTTLALIFQLEREER